MLWKELHTEEHRPAFIRENGARFDIGMAGYYFGMNTGMSPGAKTVAALYTMGADGSLNMSASASLINGTISSPQEGGKDGFISALPCGNERLLGFLKAQTCLREWIKTIRFIWFACQTLRRTCRKRTGSAGPCCGKRRNAAGIRKHELASQTILHVENKAVEHGQNAEAHIRHL